MAFSWEELKKYTVQHKIDRAIIMAKNGKNVDFNIRHPDWIKSAQNNQFTDLRLKIKQEAEKRQQSAMDRRVKRSGIKD